MVLQLPIRGQEKDRLWLSSMEAQAAGNRQVWCRPELRCPIAASKRSRGHWQVFEHAGSLAKLPAHKAPVRTGEPGDVVEDITPEVEVVALTDDPAILMQSQPRDSIDRRAGIPLELHRHLPLHEDAVVRSYDTGQMHPQLLATACQAHAHGLEVLKPADFLNAVSEDDILVVVGEDVGPVGFTFAVVGCRPQRAYFVHGQVGQ